MLKKSIYRQFDPAPFQILLKGQLNNTPLTIEGSGVVSRLGVYEAVLNFSAMPPHFHPCAVAAYTLSICCYSAAAMRNNGLNIRSMGAKDYATRRTLTFKNGRIVIDGNLVWKGGGFVFSGSINGKVKLPPDLAGNSCYMKKIDPTKEGTRLIGTGEGSLFRTNGREVPLRINTIHNLRPKRLSNPLKITQFRIVTESGELIGLTYRSVVHSVLDGNNTMSKTLEMKRQD